MKPILAMLGLALAVSPVWSQCHKLAEVNTASPEGQLLQQAGQETDGAKKLVLLEQFVTQYPKHEAVGWVYEQMLAGYVKAGDGANAMAIADRLAGIPPECVEVSQQSLKAAELTKDPDLILKWSAKTAELAQKVVASPKPQDADDVENWKARVDYARQVNTYTEYSLYATALRTPDPVKQIALLEALQQRNPKSEYFAKAVDTLFVAYQKSNQLDKAAAFAEKLVDSGQASEDMLLVLADDAVKKKDREKVHAYSAKLVEMMAAKPKPEGVADADWTRRKNTILGLAHYMSGKQYYEDKSFAEADKELQEALPLVEGNANIHTEVLYLLGYASYKLDKIQEAANYYRACAAVKSPYQTLATKNLTAIRGQYHGVK